MYGQPLRDNGKYSQEADYSRCSLLLALPTTILSSAACPSVEAVGNVAESMPQSRFPVQHPVCHSPTPNLSAMATMRSGLEQN